MNSYTHDWASKQQAGTSAPARRVRFSLAAFMCATVLAAGTGEASQTGRLDVLKQLSLEDLINVEVSIANKSPRRLTDVAAAVFVITNEDLVRSGATSIPEALRMVPGLQVGRIDNRNWAVGIRGFNGRFSNKLLVQIDGRSIYTPQFSGVYWDGQDVVLQDVDRIEVIRGPGATLWGANAVNGIINIITRDASETVGSLLAADAGDNRARRVVYRHGAKLANGGAYRAYVKYAHQDSPFEDGKPFDSDQDYLRRQAGFRADWGGDRGVTLQGDIYRSRINSYEFSYTLAPPYQRSEPGILPFDGENLLLRWNYGDGAVTGNTLQVYYDHHERDEISNGALDSDDDFFEETTFDLDWQQTRRYDNQQLVWGLGYRWIQTYADFARDGERSNHQFSAFVQDEWRLLDERLTLTAGAKLERNPYSGVEFQPSLRGHWRLNDDSSLWAAVSRAVRAPTRLEQDISVVPTLLPPFSSSNPLPFPVFLSFEGDPAFDSESAESMEMGFRTVIHDAVSLDLAAFYTEYEDLRTVELRDPIINISGQNPFVDVPSSPENRLAAQSHGVEVAADWQIAHWWRLRSAYTYTRLDIEPDPTSTDVTRELPEGQVPEHQLSLRSSINFNGSWSLDAWLRYVDELPTISPTQASGAAVRIPSYTAMDVRLAWQASPEISLSLAARDLLGSHTEFESEFVGGEPIKLKSSYYAQLEWRF